MISELSSQLIFCNESTVVGIKNKQRTGLWQCIMNVILDVFSYSVSKKMKRKRIQS